MAHGTHKPLSKANADVLESRLLEHVSAEVRLPFLDDVDERRIKRCVIALIVHAMATELPLEKVIDLENAKPIVVDILTRGIVSMFFEPEERSRLVDTLSSNVKNVPFVPIGSFLIWTTTVSSFFSRSVIRLATFSCMLFFPLIPAKSKTMTVPRSRCCCSAAAR